MPRSTPEMPRMCKRYYKRAPGWAHLQAAQILNVPRLVKFRLLKIIVSFRVDNVESY